MIDPSLEVGLQRRERASVGINPSLESWIAEEGESFSCDQSELGKLDCRGGRWISRKEELISEEEEQLQQQAALVN